MIRLHSDCLVFETSNGEKIPCSAEILTVELVEKTSAQIEPEVLKQAAAAVLHYFRVELHKESVSIDEFSQALQKVLRDLGFEVGDEPAVETEAVPRRIEESDLGILAKECSLAFELGFFPRLKSEVLSRLQVTPDVLHFTGLRSCVKHLTGAARWSTKCEKLEGQIVEFLRECVKLSGSGSRCALVVH